MAALTFQPSRVLVGCAGDTVDIPNPGSFSFGSVTTGTTSFKLVDTNVDFTTNGTNVGDIIQNVTDGTAAYVKAIDSATVLSVSADIMATGEGYNIYRDSIKQTGALIYVGTTGDLTYMTAGGDVVTQKNVPVGWNPVKVTRLYATLTSATDLLFGY